MNLLRKFLIGLLAISFLTFLGIYFYLQSSKPDYNEERILSNLLANVDVYYDNYGIPHIYAQNQRDLFRTFGYVHAKDRLWQMEL